MLSKKAALALIEGTENFIEAGEFEEVYDWAWHNMSIDTNDITEFFYHSGIDPLDHMKVIPNNFLAWSDNDVNQWINTIPSNIIEIGRQAFRDTDIKSVVIPSSVKTIGRRSFYKCEDLESVYIEDGTEVIEQRAFGNCNKLSEIHIPASVTTIKLGAFYYISDDFKIEYAGTKEQFINLVKSSLDFIEAGDIITNEDLLSNIDDRVIFK